MGIYRSCNWIKNSRIFFSKPVIVLYIVVLIVLHIKIYKYGKLDKSDISSGDRMFRRWIQHAERQRNPPETSFNLSQCLPSHESLTDLQGIKTPFKIYIYDIPSKFNSDIVSCVQRKTLRQSCYSLDYCGMGRGLYNITDYSSVHDTHMFALEVVLHHKLMFSSFRTMDPEKADIFYIPAYVGLKCICNMMDHTQNQSVEDFVSELSELLQDKHYFKQGKPHFSSVGKIQREMQYNRCPYLQSEIARNITYFGIEQEKSKHYLARYPKYGTQVISVPYPSYIHYRHTSNKHINIIKMPRLHQRNVFVLLAAGRRKTNRERAKIMQQFSVHTDLHYNIYKPYLNSSDNMVFYYTDECRKNPKWGTIPWMLRSVFCLQPPGDSPTRKSFFDAILSGCIPVLFPYTDHDSAWPFMEYFTFSDFTVTFDIHKIVSGELEILDALKKISHKEIKRLNSNVKAVSKWFQYSLPDGRIQDPDDAMFYIFKELQRVYNFTISTL